MRVFFCLSFTLVIHSLFAQKETTVGLALHSGLMYTRSSDVENTKGRIPYAVQLEWNKQLLDDKTWDLCNCYPRTGVILQYFNYNDPALGSSFNALAYIEPYWGYGKPISASFKIMAGMAYLTNPYSSDKNPTNQSYSLLLGIYSGIGFGLHTKLNKNLNLNLYTNYNHISNGGIKDPNNGINWLTASFGIDYIIKPVPLPNRSMKPFERKTALHNWEIVPYWSSRVVIVGEKQRWQIMGVAGQYTRQIAPINALSVAAEIGYDFSLQERLSRIQSESTFALRSGLLIGHTFLMGKFLLSQQLGFAVVNPSGFHSALYQRYGLMYQFAPHFNAGINVLVHANNPDFLDFRLGYVISPK